MTMTLDAYKPNDVLKLKTEAVIYDPVFWHNYMPPGQAWTLRRENGSPVACLGVWRDGELRRAWCRVEDDLGIASWGRLFRVAHKLLSFFKGMTLECHVPDMRIAACVERFGFHIVSDEGVLPIRMRTLP